jgi:RNA polymerase primary sigma factor
MADQRELWKDGLERLRQTAAGKSYHVTVGDIVKCFQGIELDRQKVARIYQYADEKNIIIDDYEPHDTYSITVTNIDEDDDDDEGAAEDMADPRPQIRVERTAIKTGRGAASVTVSKDGRAEDGLGKEEKAYLDDYLRALRDIEEEADGETGWLLERLLSGDDSVASRLTEINLRTVVDMAKRVAGKGVAIGDLIQEGNLALVSAIDDYRTTGLTAIDEEFRVMLYTKIEQAMDAAIGEETHFTETAEKLARDANRLLTLTRELEEQLGRSASLTELAEKMGEVLAVKL